MFLGKDNQPIELNRNMAGELYGRNAWDPLGGLEGNHDEPGFFGYPRNLQTIRPFSSYIFSEKPVSGFQGKYRSLF